MQNNPLQTYDQFMAQVLAIWPEAVVLEDSNGELTISTGLTSDANNNVIPLEA